MRKAKKNKETCDSHLRVSTFRAHTTTPHGWPTPAVMMATAEFHGQVRANGYGRRARQLRCFSSRNSHLFFLSFPSGTPDDEPDDAFTAGAKEAAERGQQYQGGGGPPSPSAAGGAAALAAAPPAPHHPRQHPYPHPQQHWGGPPPQLPPPPPQLAPPGAGPGAGGGGPPPQLAPPGPQHHQPPHGRQAAWPQQQGVAAHQFAQPPGGAAPRAPWPQQQGTWPAGAAQHHH